MKNYITTIVVIGVVTSGFVLLSRSQSDSGPASSGKLIADHMSYDFGRISMASGKVRHSFMMKNESGGPVNIRQMYTSCMCTTATWKQGQEADGPFGMPGHGMTQRMNRMMGAGEQAEVEVEFDPAAHGPAGVGKVQRDVIVETEEGVVKLGFTAEVMP